MSEQPRSTGLSARQTLLLRDRLRAARTAAVAHDPIPRQSRQNTNPTSFGQQRLHYLYELYPESSAYHLQLRCTINGPLDVARLGNALAGVVARHQTLHSVIRWIDGELRAEPRPELSLETTVIDVTELGSVDQNRAVDKSVTADGQQRFELHTVFPVRATVLRRSPASHVLLLTFHHIAVDERSLDLILQQIADGYSTTDPTNSQTADVDGPTYADFAAWQRQSSTDLIAARQYWCSRLQKPPAEIHLPVDDSSLDTSTLRGHQVSGVTPLNVAAQLRQLAVEQNVTPFILQLAAFNVLLHRYSAATDLVVGTPVSNRTRPELRNVVGFFVETLPLRSDLSGQLSFVDLLQQVRHTVTEAFQHAVLPFEKIVKAVNPERISRRNPLFNVMFASQTVPNTIQLADGLTLTPQIIDSGASKFDLTMFAGDLSSQRGVTIEYSADRFRREAMERFRDHWMELLASIADSPDSPVSQLNLLSASECRRLATVIQDSDRTSLPVECIHELIENQAAHHPERTAMTWQDRSFSYADLNALASVVAQQLRADGLLGDTCVAVCLERSPALLVAILGILKAGAAYLPLDPAQPDLRRQQILQDCQPGAAIVQSAHAALFDNFTGTLFLSQSPDESTFHRSRAVDSGSHQAVEFSQSGSVAGSVAQPTTDQPDSLNFGNGSDKDSPAASSATLAYVIYTSGSTGIPRGVEVTHGSLVASTIARFNYYAESPQRFLLLSPCWFDSSVAGIFWTLCTGGTLVLPPPQLEHDIAALADLIAEQKVTHALCLPSLYEVLLDHAADRISPSLRTMIVAGEPCSPRVVRKHFARLSGTELFNEYGPTEATVWSTVHKVSSSDVDIVPIGKPVPGTAVFLLDNNLQPVPDGIPGEVCISGPQLARGYRNRPDLTTTAFVSNPLLEFPPFLMYRTGDMATQRSDGSLIFLGRIDNQFKINGHRVEAEEIENALACHPGIRDVVVGEVRVESFVVNSDVASLAHALEQMPTGEANTLLTQAESHGATTQDADSARTVTHRENGVAVTFELPGENYIATPRPRQRKWLLGQALREAASDLQHLKGLADQFVVGNDEPHVPRDIASAMLTEQEIMEDWQYPLMKAMAHYAAEAHGDVLEIGFGRGVSAELMQNVGVRSHTIVEVNSHSIANYFDPWRRQFPDRDIRMIEGRWQDVLDQLEDYDSVFFHAFPLDEAEFVEYVANSVTFAEHFFPTAARLLREGGVFTYLTTEIDSLSRRHQRSLFRHFRELQFRRQRLSVSPDTKDAWWADSMVVLRAIK